MSKNKKLLWSKSEKKILSELSAPIKIQNYLDQLKYNITDYTYSPRMVMRKKIAHCFDGAMLAAAALEFHGYPAKLIDLRSDPNLDDDHVLAVYQINGYWGAIAKSNFLSLRSREPVYRSLRELAMSYFHIYFNIKGARSLREYSATLDLSKIKDVDWRYTEDDLSFFGDRLDQVRHYRLISPKMQKILSIADPRTLKAEIQGIDLRGVYQV